MVSSLVSDGDWDSEVHGWSGGLCCVASSILTMGRAVRGLVGDRCASGGGEA